MKKQMMKEQRENQLSATGHDFGNNTFKLVGVHILEMYNPMKKFLQQASGGGKTTDKDNSKKEKPKKEMSLFDQIEKQVKESKAMVAGQPESADAMGTITKKQNKLGATATSAISSDLNATQ